MEDFKYPDTPCRSHTGKPKQSRRFLESTDDNFLTKLVEDLTRIGVLLDLIQSKRESHIGDVSVGGRLRLWNSASGEEEVGLQEGLQP